MGIMGVAMPPQWSRNRSCTSTLSRILSSTKFRVFCCLFFVVLLSQNVCAQLIYSVNGTQQEALAIQLWYEGLWKEPPYESTLREISAKGAKGAVRLWLSLTPFMPGYSMYEVDGRDRRMINIPVVEAVFGTPTTSLITSLQNGANISVRPMMPNPFKAAADTPFQMVFNFILSFWELAIILIGSYRLYELYLTTRPPAPGFRFRSPAFLCLSLEIVGAIIRFCYTLVDPFLAYRMIPYVISVPLLTVSWPLTLSAGIILTFFWAEVLNKHKVQVTPFISAYAIPAACVVAFLIVVEIVCTTIMMKFVNGLWAYFLTSAVYIVVGLILTVCYIVAAVQIRRRINELPGADKKRTIRTMTWRVAASSAGYIIFALSLLLYILIGPMPWGRQPTLNMTFVGHNLASLMQVIATRPTHRKGTGSGNKSTIRSVLDTLAGRHPIQNIDSYSLGRTTNTSTSLTTANSTNLSVLIHAVPVPLPLSTEAQPLDPYMSSSSSSLSTSISRTEYDV